MLGHGCRLTSPGSSQGKGMLADSARGEGALLREEVPLWQGRLLTWTLVGGGDSGKSGPVTMPVSFQERIAKSHGTQCGFCTPGMVMSMYTLLRNHPQPSEEQLLEALGGRSDLRLGGGMCHAVLPPTMPPQPHSGTPSIVSEVTVFTRSRECQA